MEKENILGLMEESIVEIITAIKSTVGGSTLGGMAVDTRALG